METKESLYIPMGIKEANEFWDGFGAKELKGALSFMLFSMVLNTIVWLLLRSTFVFIASTIIIIATSLMLHTKGSTNLSVIDQISNIRTFSKSQKKYEYKSIYEWR